jgi:hypothetical protein
MDIREQKILLATAKIAKDKGFDSYCNASYTVYLCDQIDPEYPEGGGAFSMTKDEVEVDYNLFQNNNSQTDYSCESYYMCAAPTQTLLAKWLRETHDIHVEIYANASGWGWILTKTNGTGIKEITDDIFFDNYEIAMEIGLNQALELI